MKKIYFVVLFIIIKINLMSQEDWHPNKIVPVSPNAAALGVYGSIPVGHYNGIPNISIPLYEIDLDGKTFPISLSYHASGIKVAQEASWVGLGWSLNAGGCITKEVRGWDDFESAPIGYYFDENNIPIGSDNHLNWYEVIKDFSGLASYLTYRDPEPDLFHFNFGGFSGTMFFQKKGINGNSNQIAKPIIQKAGKYMSAVYDIIYKRWIISDGDGYTYFFSSYETTTSYSMPYGYNKDPGRLSGAEIFRLRSSTVHPQHEVLSSWMLDSIVSPLRNKITFEYKKEKIYTIPTLNESVFTQIARLQQGINITSGVQSRYEYYNYSQSQVEQLVLTKISSNHCEIKFNTTERDDLEPVDIYKKPGKLSTINISNKIGNIKNFSFDYEKVITPNNYARNRIQLNGLKEYNGNEERKYQFVYNTTALPTKTSNSIDIWGYYNGVDNGRSCWGFNAPMSLIEQQTKIPTYLTGRDDFPMIKGVDRGVKFQYTQAGILTQIIYPTGGKTVFEYEPHEYNNYNSESSTGAYVTKTLAHVTSKNFYEEEETPKPDVLTVRFSVSSTISATMSTYFTIDDENKEQSNNPLAIRLFKYGSDGVIQKYDLGEYKIMDRCDDMPLVLSPGNYELTIFGVDEYFKPNYKYSLWSYITYMDFSTNSPENLPKAGIRIKNISNVDGNKNIAKMNYDYQSSGLLMSEPEFCNLILVNEFLLRSNPKTPISNIGINDFLFVRGYSDSYTPFSFSASGSLVGYCSVKETNSLNNQNNGYAIYNFFNEPDETPELGSQDIPRFPTIPKLNNGLPVKTSYFDKNGDAVKTITYNYEQVDRPSIKGMRVVSIPFTGENHSSDINSIINIATVNPSNEGYQFISDYSAKFYDIYSQWWKLTKETTTEYNNNNPVTTTKEYSYNENFMQTSVKYYDSRNNLIEKQIKYPTDYADPVSIGMRNKQMVGIPVETITLNQGNVISANKTVYKDTLSMYLPGNIFSFNSQTPASLSIYNQYYTPEYAIDKYNKKGCVLQIRGKDNLPITYLWSYNGKYPVAEIKNASYSEVEAILTKSYIENLENMITPDITKINDLRSNPALKNAQVNTYTYLPLIGLKYMIDSRGNRINYNYDSFNRLEYIRDKDNSIIELYRYNYRK